MMLSRSSEFIEELERCMSELFDQHENASSFIVTVDPRDSLKGDCNSTVFERMEAYVTPLWESNFLLALIYCCIVGVALFVGTIGNLIIIIINVSARTMNRVGRDFVINLALADLCVAAVADPMCILGVVKGERWFQGRWLLCEVVASMCLTACFCAFFNLSLMTFNRYVFVCLNTWYEKIFKRPVCIFLCVVTWAAAFMFEFPNIIGWGDHYFDEKSHQCIWNRKASFSYTLLVSAGLIGMPLLLMGLCFCAIFNKIYRSKKDVFSLDLDDPMRMTRVWRESWRSSKTLVIVFIAFVVCWTPYAVITAVDVNDTFSMETHLLVTLLAHLHSSLNFTIYTCSNEKFRRSVLALLRCSVSSWKYRSSMETMKTHSRIDSDKMSSIDGGMSGDFYKNITSSFAKRAGFYFRSGSKKESDDKCDDECSHPRF